MVFCTKFLLKKCAELTITRTPHVAPDHVRLKKKEPFGSVRWECTLWHSTLYLIGTAGLFFSRPTRGLKLGLAVGGSLPPFLVLPRKGIRGVAGFPAWRTCRFGALSASIFIPRPWAAALATRWRWWSTFRLRGGFLVSSRTPALPAGKPPPALGVSPLTVFIIAPTGLFVKHFFYFF